MYKSYHHDENVKSLLQSLQVSLDCVPYKTFILNRRGEIVYINKRLTHILKIDSTSQFHDQFTTLIDERFRELRSQKWKACLNEEKDFIFEYLLYISDYQEYRWVQENVKPIRDTDQNTCYWLSSITDIHKFKTSIDYKDALRMKLESAQKDVSAFKYALDQSSIVAVTDSRGIITYVNDKFCEISKYSYSELIGKTHKIINSDFHSRDFFQELWQTIASGKVWEGEIKNKAKDGSEYWVSTFIVPFLAEDGKPFQYMAIRTDITARKVAEAERLRLEASEKAALEASRLKSQFLANMSHEIRTPLNGILGMTQILNNSELTAAQKEYSQTILDSANHLSLVVNDILDLAKIESGKMHLEVSEFCLDEMVSGLDRSLRHLANMKGISLKVSVNKETGGFFRGDFLRIRQILLNLTQNAVKFTDHGFVHLKVSTRNENGRAWIKFSVEDTGIGMTHETLNSIFNPFVQADSSTTRRYGGTGLGLSICRKLADLMGGELTATSQLAKGSTFEFTVPLEEIAHLTTVLPVIKTKLTKEERKRLSILVAEDHPTNQKVIKKVLENFGCEFTIVSDGYEAIQALSAGSFDLVLMDCHMPNCDGFTASKMIRAKNNLTPIIALTADVMKGTKERCFNAGMNSHISKPIDAETLYLEIEKMTQNNVSATTLMSTLNGGYDSNEVVFDKDIISKLEVLSTGPEDDFVAEMILDFIDKTPLKMQELKTAIENSEHDLSYNLSHNMKTVSGTLGLTKFSKMCASIENLSHKKESHKAMPEFERLMSNFQQSRDCLVDFRLK